MTLRQNAMATKLFFLLSTPPVKSPIPHSNDASSASVMAIRNRETNGTSSRERLPNDKLGYARCGNPLRPALPRTAIAQGKTGGPEADHRRCSAPLQRRRGGSRSPEPLATSLGGRRRSLSYGRSRRGH